MTDHFRSMQGTYSRSFVRQLGREGEDPVHGVSRLGRGTLAPFLKEFEELTRFFRGGKVNWEANQGPSGGDTRV